MSTTDRPFRDRVTNKLPSHLANWQLPQDWRWGTEGVEGEHRHYQEVVDELGRSLSLVSSLDPDHESWLHSEARNLAHLNHPSIPTTYYYWSRNLELQRGPGYLRRWIAGETLWSRLSRTGSEDLSFVLQLLRSAGSALAYMHSGGTVHGALSAETCWVTPTGRIWLLGWEWAIPRAEMPAGQADQEINRAGHDQRPGGQEVQTAAPAVLIEDVVGPARADRAAGAFEKRPGRVVAGMPVVPADRQFEERRRQVIPHIAPVEARVRHQDHEPAARQRQQAHRRNRVRDPDPARMSLHDVMGHLTTVSLLLSQWRCVMLIWVTQ